MHHPKDRKFFLIFSLLAIILVLIFRNATFNHFQPVPTPTPTPTPVPQSVTVTLDLGTKKITSLLRDSSATGSALTLLQDLSARQNIPLVTKHYSFGTLVESIGDLKNTKNKAWIYFVNGKSASVGADSYQPASGDVIEWKYIKPAF